MTLSAWRPADLEWGYNQHLITVLEFAEHHRLVLHEGWYDERWVMFVDDAGPDPTFHEMEISDEDVFALSTFLTLVNRERGGTWEINGAGRARLAALRAERKAASPGEKIWL